MTVGATWRAGIDLQHIALQYLIALQCLIALRYLVAAVSVRT